MRNILSVIMVMGIGFFAAHQAAAQEVGIAAIVNESIITTTDVRDRLEILRAFANAPDTEQANRMLTRQALTDLMNEALQQEEAKRLSIKVKNKEVDEAMARIEQARGREPGSLKQFIAEARLSEYSFEEQLRTQAAWGKVVRRRLRRNVTVSDEEIARAQEAFANKAGTPHVRIAAIAIPIAGSADAERAAAFASDIRTRLISGESFDEVARSFVGRDDVRLNPSIWVPEEKLESAIAAVVRTLKPGQVTEPLRSLNTFQIVQLQDRRMILPASPETEIAVKQISLSLQGTQDKREMDALMSIAKQVQKNPGDCTHKAVAGIGNMAGLDMEVNFIRTKLKDVADPLLPTVSALNVSEVSEPFVSKDGMQMLMLCEKVAPAIPVPDEERVREQLFAQKIELEAEKHLRNLKRDAFIDVKLEAGSVL